MPIILRPLAARESLVDRLAVLGSSRRRIAIATGVLLLIAVVVGAALAACAFDAWLHLPPIARGAALVATLAAGGVVWLRGIAVPLRFRTHPLAVALELEKRYPELNDSLASAVSFLEPGSGEGLSPRLRDASVRAAERLAEGHDLNRLVPSSRFLRVAWLCVVVVGAAIPLILWDPARAGVALVRLTDPFGGHPWPPKTRIEILVPESLPARVPKGQTFELRFAVRGVIPAQATVSFRLSDGSDFEKPYPLLLDAQPGAAPAGTPPSRDALARKDRTASVVIRVEPAQLPIDFQFRIRANDADTGWQAVTVVAPPKLAALPALPGEDDLRRHASPLIRVFPPAYTGLAPADLPDGTTDLQIPAGSRIVLRAAADAPLAHAVLGYLGDRAALERSAGFAHFGHRNPIAAVAARLLAGEVGADVPVALSPDGRVMSIAFTPVVSGSYALKMMDSTGMIGTQELTIGLIPDPVPEVSLLRPLAGRDPPVLVPTASVGIIATATDKTYALRRMFLEYQVGRTGPVRTIPLADARRVPDVAPAVAGGVAAAFTIPRPVWYERMFLLPVAAFRRDDGSPVREGDVIYFRAAADDWDDVSVLKPPGRSTDRGRPPPGEFELRIVTPEAAEAFLQKELAALRPELTRLRALQEDARRKVEEVRDTLRKTGGVLAATNRERLLAIEQAQRHILARVADERDGLLARAEMLRDTAAANGLLQPDARSRDATGRVADVVQGLRDLGGGKLPAVATFLEEVRQQASPPSGSDLDSPTARLLTRTVRGQQAVEDGFTDLLGLLSIWGGMREVLGEARLLRDAVAREADRIDRLPEEVPLGTYPEDLTGERAVGLPQLRRRFYQLADRADRLLLLARKVGEDQSREAFKGLTDAANLDTQAAGLRSRLGMYPDGTPEQRDLITRADALAARAADLRAAAREAEAEARALRKCVRAAGDLGLVEKLREAGADLARNQQGRALLAVRRDPKDDAADAGRTIRVFGAGVPFPRTTPRDLDRPALVRLDDLIAALIEEPTEPVPELAKKQAQQQKAAADELDALAAAQDRIIARAAAAAGIQDPVARAAAFRDLAREQANLVEQGRAIVQRLTRENPDAARDARRAVENMAAARDELEQGRVPSRTGRAAVEKLDDARDRLDRAAADTPRQAREERRKKLYDRVQELLDRHKAEAARAARVHAVVLKAARVEWDAGVRREYADLEEREEAIAAQVRTLADTEFGTLPVFEYMLRDAAGAMEKAAGLARTRRENANNADPGVAFDAEFEASASDRVRRPLDLATRRLEQVLDALKAAASPTAPPGQPGAETETETEVIPPLAQLKALRALQAELNQRTAEFNRDPKKAPPDELAEIEATQRKLTELFGKMAEVFKKLAEPPKENVPE